MEITELFSAEILKEARRNIAAGNKIPLTSDIGFKMFLSQETESSNYCLRKILSAVIGREVVEAKVINPELLPDFIGLKSPRLDVNVRFNNGDRASLEMQCTKRKDNQLLRTIFYSGKLLSAASDEGKKYKDLRYVHQIMFANFTYFDDKKFVHNFRLKDDDNNIATDRYSVHFIELTKLQEIIKDKLDFVLSQENSKNLSELEFWSIMLKFSNNDDIMQKLSIVPQFQEEFKMAASALSEITQEEKEWAYHLSFDRAETDYKNEMELAKEEGFEQGSYDAKIEAAKNALAMNLTPDQVAKISGLSLAEIKSIAM